MEALKLRRLNTINYQFNGTKPKYTNVAKNYGAFEYNDLDNKPARPTAIVYEDQTPKLSPLDFYIYGSNDNLFGYTNEAYGSNYAAKIKNANFNKFLSKNNLASMFKGPDKVLDKPNSALEYQDLLLKKSQQEQAKIRGEEIAKKEYDDAIFRGNLARSKYAFDSMIGKIDIYDLSDKNVKEKILNQVLNNDYFNSEMQNLHYNWSSISKSKKRIIALDYIGTNLTEQLNAEEIFNDLQHGPNMLFDQSNNMMNNVAGSLQDQIRDVQTNALMTDLLGDVEATQNIQSEQELKDNEDLLDQKIDESENPFNLLAEDDEEETKTGNTQQEVDTINMPEDVGNTKQQINIIGPDDKTWGNITFNYKGAGRNNEKTFNDQLLGPNDSVILTIKKNLKDYLTFANDNNKQVSDRELLTKLRKILKSYKKTENYKNGAIAYYREQYPNTKKYDVYPYLETIYKFDLLNKIYADIDSDLESDL